MVAFAKLLFMVNESNTVCITFIAVPAFVAPSALMAAISVIVGKDRIYSRDVALAFMLLYMILFFANKYYPVRYAFAFNLSLLVTFVISDYYVTVYYDDTTEFYSSFATWLSESSIFTCIVLMLSHQHFHREM